MGKYWYTFLLSISLTGAALVYGFPGWINPVLLKAEGYLPGSSMISRAVAMPENDGQIAQENPERQEMALKTNDSSEAGFPGNGDSGSGLPEVTESGAETESSNAAEALKAAETPSTAETSSTDHNAPLPDKNFSGVLFIGDSRTVGLSEYGNLGNAEVFANSGMSVYNLFDARVQLRDGSRKSLEQVLSQNRYLTIYLMLGINELGYDYRRTVKQYQSVVSRIQEMQPDAHLILQANLHVTQEKSSKNPVYSNENINTLNGEIKKIADARGCYYIDVNRLFDDENGNLNAQYTSDGSHVLGKYYSRWVEWLRSGK